MDIKLEDNSVVVISESVNVLTLHNFLVFELKDQLRNWLESVTEESAESFIFESSNINEVGLFRIEPRPGGWQFTSIDESERSSELLSLQEWREVLSNVLQPST